MIKNCDEIIFVPKLQKSVWQQLIELMLISCELMFNVDSSVFKNCSNEVFEQTLDEIHPE